MTPSLISVDDFAKYVSSDPVEIIAHGDRLERADLVIKALEVIGDSTKHGECWCYPQIDNGGYAKVRYDGRYTTASRLVLCAATNKPLSYGMDACHRTPLCRFRNCINPDHLFWETHAENCRRRELERRARAVIAGEAKALSLQYAETSALSHP
jgi:hypothetical protein